MPPEQDIALSEKDLTLLLNIQADRAPVSSEDVLPLVYDELRRMASRQMAGETHDRTLQATALVHEAWLRLNPGEPRVWNDRGHFFRVAVKTMRRILVDRARQRSCLKHCDENKRLSLEDVPLIATTPSDRILLINSALLELEKEDSSSAKLIDLKFFGGFTNKELAWMNEVTERTIERQWAYAKARLFQLLQENE